MKKKILVVDNEPKLRSLIERVLVERGYEVATAANGRDALQRIFDFSPHLVVSDAALPEMDGFELCRRIRDDSRYGTLRFIFLTSKGAREDEIKGLELGADDYITKPIDVAKLVARVDARLRWLDKVIEKKGCEGIIEGSLAARNLIDVLQILELGQKTGELEVTSGTREAKIFISLGSIASARCGTKKGKVAVYTSLTWSEGRFCFTPTEDVEAEERMEITPLLLEWAKISDDFARSRRESSANLVDEFIRYIREREEKPKS